MGSYFWVWSSFRYTGKDHRAWIKDKWLCKVSYCLKFYGHYLKPVKIEVTLKKEGSFSFSKKFSSFAKTDEHFPPSIYLGIGK